MRGLFFAEREGGDVGGKGVDDVCLMCFCSFGLTYARTMTSNARGFAECTKTSTDCCLVLDGLERNSTLTRLSLKCEIGMQAHVMLLGSGWWGRVAVLL